MANDETVQPRAAEELSKKYGPIRIKAVAAACSSENKSKTSSRDARTDRQESSSDRYREG